MPQFAMTAQQPPTQAHEEHLVSALHAALHSLSSTTDAAVAPTTGTHSPAHSPGATKHASPSLDIQVANDQLYLRGTGVDVEPTLLTGNVVLQLSEPTSIRQIVLVFRGKARVPSNPHDPHVLNNSPNQYIVCSHEWTFLEGEKKHNHTLKAGRHLFPFELRLGGSLPSSLATYVNGGASISYKLRATAVRPGLATANLAAALPITLLRTFAPESLEYQQTLEIENTWPEKVMYALMIPHKAWAAGDELTALLKFAPIQKGVRVLTVTTHLCETTRTLARGGHLEKTRNVVSRKHEIVNGRAVGVEDMQRKRLHSALQSIEMGQGQGARSGTSSPGYPAGGTSAFVSGTSTPIIEGLNLALSRHDSGSNTSSSLGASSSTAPAPAPSDSETDGVDSEVTTAISISLPASLTPSHSLDPIIVSYRVRWSVLLGNLDGHTSELRCSLPIHVLDYSLLEEARTATLATRRLLFGGEGAPKAVGEEEAQLPSYPSHVRDRVAVDVGVGAGEEGGDFGQPVAMPSSVAAYDGAGTGMTQSQMQLAMQSRGATPPESSSAESSRPSTRPSSRLGRENSFGGSTNANASGSGSGWGPFSLSRRPSRSRIQSRANSRAPSRSGSPERSPTSAPAEAHSPGVSRADETHVHASNAASRQPHGLFSVVMKPLTSLTSFAAPWHSSSHNAALAQHLQHAVLHHRAGSVGVGVGGVGVGMSASAGDLRALTVPSSPGVGGLYAHGHGHLYAGGTGVSTPDVGGGGVGSSVPDYFTASHSGRGVPPLETLRGLPTYEDSEAQAHPRPRRGARDDEEGERERGEGREGREREREGEGEMMRSFSEGDLALHFARSTRVR